MIRPQLTLASFASLSLALAVPASAGDSASLIPISQAVQTAQSQVAGDDTPIKVELEANDGPLHYEVKTFTDSNTLWEVHVNASSGAAFNVDSSDGGGAQDKIAEAQQVINVASFTLLQAIAHFEAQFPDYFLSEIEMEVRDGVPIFDADMIRGIYKLELRMRAADNVILKQSLHIMVAGNNLRNLHIPEDGGSGDSPLPSDVSTFMPANQIIVAAQQAFAGSEAFDVELDQLTGGGYRYEIRLLQGSVVVKAKFHPVTGTLLNSQTITDAQYVTRVQTALNNASLTLLQAINAARPAAPGKFVDEAELRLQSNGALYEVEFLTNAGALEVKVNSTTGAIVKIEFED